MYIRRKRSLCRKEWRCIADACRCFIVVSGACGDPSRLWRGQLAAAEPKAPSPVANRDCLVAKPKQRSGLVDATYAGDLGEQFRGRLSRIVEWIGTPDEIRQR